MTKKTNITPEIIETSEAIVATDMSQLNRDLVASILVVSLVINMFFLIAWIALQVTGVYDAEVALFLFSR